MSVREKREERLMVVRVQRKRTKGWRMPPDTVYVGRPTHFANCFNWQDHARIYGKTEEQARSWAIDAFRAVWVANASDDYRPYLDQLRGKDLACWCAPNQRCHADILLELANR